MPHILIVENPADRAQAEQDIFNRPLEDHEYGDLAGDIVGNAEVRVRYFEPWAHINGIATIRVRTKNQLSTTVVRMIPGRFDFSSCNVAKTRSGAGAIILLRIAHAAKDRGFTTLTAVGEKARNQKTGQRTSWGYYSFPRLGFEADIPVGTPPRPTDLAACTKISELLASEAGREFWWESGVQVPHMEFVLADGSPSWDRLNSRFG